MYFDLFCCAYNHIPFFAYNGFKLSSWKHIAVHYLYHRFIFMLAKSSILRTNEIFKILVILADYNTFGRNRKNTLKYSIFGIEIGLLWNLSVIFMDSKDDFRLSPVLQVFFYWDEWEFCQNITLTEKNSSLKLVKFISVYSKIS